MNAGIAFFLGGGCAAMLMLLRQQSQRARAKMVDERMYKRRWEEAVRLMPGEGRLSETEAALILAPGTGQGMLPCGQGYSSDRARTEVRRAKAGLPPADNLELMSSGHVRKVHAARIKYGTV
jgi:hypothetical protein